MLLPKNEEENSAIFLLKGGGVFNYNPPVVVFLEIEQISRIASLLHNYIVYYELSLLI